MALLTDPSPARLMATAEPTNPGQPKHAKPTTGYATKDEADKARTRIADLNDIANRTQYWVQGIGGVAIIFTITNVTLFAVSHGIPVRIAWILDLVVNLALVRVLYVDGRLAILIPDYKPSGWSLALRYFAFFSTWLMNVWTSLYPGGHFVANPLDMRPDPAGLLLHSVLPFLVFAMAEYSSHNRVETTEEVTKLQAVIDSYEEGVKAEASAEAARQKAEADENKANAKREKEEERARRDEERRREREDEERRRAEERAEAEAERQHQAELRALEVEKEKAAALAQVKEAEAATEAARIQAEAEADIKRKQAAFELEQRAKDEETRRQAELMKTQAQIQAEEEARRRAEEEARRQAEADARRRAEEEKKAKAEAERQRKLDEARQALNQPSDTEVKEEARIYPQATEPTEGNIIGHVSREERRRIQEEATEDAARILILKPSNDNKATREDKNTLMTKYGKGERWVEQRFTDARARLDSDDAFRDRMETEALEQALASVS